MNRLEALASELNFEASPAQLLNNLLNWAETKLHTPSAENKEKQLPSPTHHNQELLTSAISTIANFSETLYSTLSPLTGELKRVVDHLDTLPHREVKPDSIPEVAAKEETPIDDENNHTSLDTQSFSQVLALDPQTLQSTLDALHTAISLKQTAISKEKKKRSKVDLHAIEQWQQEINRLEHTIRLLQDNTSE